MSSKLESDVCCRLQVAPSGESYEGKCRPGRKQRHATCGLTACTPESAPGPTLGDEYGKTLLFTMQFSVLRIAVPYQKPDINIINYLGIKFRFFACCAVAVPLYLPLL